MKKDKKLIGVGLLTTMASSLCCITPVLALVSGTSGVASTFSWLEPFRPYLIVVTVLVLGFAWYQRLKPNKKIDCNCESNEKTSFLQSKLFLGIVTVFSIVMTAFPYYSSVFYSNTPKEVMVVDPINVRNINFKIEGMTCASCEEHIDHSVNELSGIINVQSSYEKGNTKVEFDNSKITKEEIKKVINLTGYSVIN